MVDDVAVVGSNVPDEAGMKEGVEARDQSREGKQMLLTIRSYGSQCRLRGRVARSEVRRWWPGNALAVMSSRPKGGFPGRRGWFALGSFKVELTPCRKKRWRRLGNQETRERAPS